MSASKALARADKLGITTEPRPTPLFDLWANPAAIPGSFDATPLDRPLHAGGLEWLPSHAEPWASSIGYALAVELGSQPVSLVKAGA